MSNWYSKLNINLKNNNYKINAKKISDFLNQKYNFESSIEIVSDNCMEFYGDEGETILSKDKPGYLPDAEELFIGICLAVKVCDIEASLFSECSMEDGFNEYKLNFNNDRIIISISSWVWKAPFYDYKNYDLYCEDYGDEIPEEQFNDAIKNHVIYQGKY